MSVTTDLEDDLSTIATAIEKAKDVLREEYRAKGFPPEFDLLFHFNVNDPYVVPGVVIHGKLCFEAKWEQPDTLPALPLLTKGEAWHTGWDIATQWAIDAKKRCWMDNAHGHPLYLVTEKQLLSNLSENKQSLARAHAALGKKPPLPEWMAAALGAGWTPPAEFDRSAYE